MNLCVNSCVAAAERKQHSSGSENWFDDFLSLSPGSQMNSLECLDLSNNNLSVVPKGLPRNLVLLHLEKNSIRSIPGDALISVRNLEYLLLHNNNIRSRSIHPAAFQVRCSFISYSLRSFTESHDRVITWWFYWVFSIVGKSLMRWYSPLLHIWHFEFLRNNG